MKRTWTSWMRRAGCVACSVLMLDAVVRATAPGAEASPSDSPTESARVELGRRLFFDPVASRTGTRSCADCHDPSHGYCDPIAFSQDARGPTPRRTQTLIDCADSPTMDWLGAFNRMEDVVEARTQVPKSARTTPVYYGGEPSPGAPALVSPTVPDAMLTPCEDVIASAGRYRTAFEVAFGQSRASDLRVINAISAYCKSIRSNESDYDRFAAGDATALSSSAKRGLDLFQGAAGCVACHPMKGKRATFTDYEFHETGLPSKSPVVITVLAGTPLPLRLSGSRAAGLLGAAGLTPLLPLGASGSPPPSPPGTTTSPTTKPRVGFKTPTLRDVARHGPFMHDGSLETLEEVVEFFLTKPSADTQRDPLMPTYVATGTDVEDLVAFLCSLTSKTRPGTARAAWSARASRTTLRFVDAEDRPLAGRSITLAPAGDFLPSATLAPETLHLVTDKEGKVSYVPPATTHVRIVLEGGLLPEGGCWVPDTCTNAKIALPVRGTGRLRIRRPADVPAPEWIELRHDHATFLPDTRLPVTLLHKEGEATAGGVSVALYAGEIRTDAGPTSTLVLPPGLVGDEKVFGVTLSEDEIPTILLRR